MSGWRGGRVTARATCVLAPNPGPLTLDGTNTWVLAEPSGEGAVVVDPGPDEEAHLRAVLDTARSAGREVALALLTHRHADHAEGARRFADLAGCPVRAADPAYCHRADPLAADEELTVGGLTLRVLATPGHTADSVCLLLAAEQILLTGDTVLGRGTAVVAYPDGRLGPYLASLGRLLELAATGHVGHLLPGHGPDRREALAVLTGYLEHRHHRLAEVREALSAGVSTPGAVVARVYADVDRSLWQAAELSVRAQLEYLEAPG